MAAAAVLVLRAVLALDAVLFHTLPNNNEGEDVDGCCRPCWAATTSTAAVFTGLAAALEGRGQAKAAGVALATTLSDVSMINFCRPGLDAIVGSGDLDYLFANLDEAEAWTGHSAAGNARALLAAMAPLARTVCITRGPLGCWVLEGGEVTAVPGVPAQAVDTNGAGDMFAGAFLYAATHGYSHAQAAELGNLTAAAVVSQHGNRLSTARLQEIKAGFEARYPRI